MIYLLSKIFIKNYSDYENPNTRQKYGMLCGGFGIFLNLCLFCIKWVAGTISGSIAITADAFNNLSDSGSSIITLIGFYISGQEADSRHPFGHGRAEYISGLIVSLAVIVMGYELFKDSFHKILHPSIIKTEPIVFIILIISIIIKIYMYSYNKIIGKKISSPAMEAVASDSIGDVLSTSIVLFSLFVAIFFNLKIDGYFGLAVSIFIFYSGFSSLKETIDPLLGSSFDPALVSEIKTIVLTNPNIYGVHDIMIHDYGPGNRIISLHCEVPSSMNLVEIHNIVDNIENELEEKIKCNATIHIDPVITNDKDTILLQEYLDKIIKDISKELTFHDFRIVRNQSSANLIFDLVVPYKSKLKDAEIINKIKSDIKRDFCEQYHVIINIDRKFY